MLAKAGLTEATLECGAHWPSGASATHGLARSGGKPSALHNNCSGKHSGFVCFACQEGIDPAGYVGIDHKVQRFVAEAVGEVTGHRLDRETAFGIDGCSIPTFAVPLKKLAHGFAKLATGEGVGPERAKAFARLRAACAAEPFMVAGSGRFCTDVMGLFSERVFVKTGAEGVFCGMLPTLGLGVAIKMWDGAARAAEVAMATLLGHLGVLPAGQREEIMHPPVKNVAGLLVGEMRPAKSWLG